MTDNKQIPIYIVTGFLGCGKTTLINKLLNQPDFENSAIIVNEFGEVGIDHLLYEKTDDNVVLLDNGCLCCMANNDLINTIQQLLRRRTQGSVPAFKAVIIETSGLAEPGPIIQSIMLDEMVAAHFSLSGVITAIDATVDIHTTLKNEIAEKQILFSERVVFTKTDLASKVQLSQVEQYISSLQPNALIFYADKERLPDQLFGFSLHHFNHDCDRHHSHTHASTYKSFTINIQTMLDKLDLLKSIEAILMLTENSILRIKGIVNIKGYDLPLAIHTVGQILYPPAFLEKWPNQNNKESILTFITDEQVEKASIESIFDYVQANSHA